MKGKFLKAIALCSLVGLGTVGLAGCGTSSTTGLDILPTTGSLSDDGSFDAKVNVTYTFKAELDESLSGTVIWATDSVADVKLVSDAQGSTCEVTVTNEGSFTISATLQGNETVKDSIKIDATKGNESYELDIDTETAKTSYLQGDKFSSEGLVVSRILLVDGTATSVSTTLTEDDYILSIDGKEVTSGDVLEEVGDFEVTVTASGVTGKYNITVVENEIYPFMQVIRSLENDNYTIGYTVSDGTNTFLATDRLVSNDYIINYNIGEVYYTTSEGVEKYSIEYNEDGTEIKSLTDSGLFYKDIATPAASIAEVNTLQGYTMASSFDESWFNDVEYSTDEDLPGFVFGQSIGEFVLNMSGYRFATVNYSVVGGLFMSDTLSDGNPYYVFLVLLSDGTSQPLSLPVYILDVGSSFDEDVENLVSKTTAKTPINDSLKYGVDAIGNGNFKLRSSAAKSETGAYTYSEVTFNDDYFYSATYNSASSSLADPILDTSYGYVNLKVNPDDPTEVNTYTVENSVDTENKFEFGASPVSFSSGVCTDYKMIGFSDQYSEDYSYTIDPTMWLGFALPGAYEGTQLEGYFDNGFYDNWNIEYYSFNDSGEISDITFALYGETAACDFMFSVFGMPYGYLQQALSITYHSITMTVYYDEAGSISGVDYAIRVTLPNSGDTAMYKGLPINWDTATLIGTGDTAKDSSLDAAIAQKESEFAAETL